MYAAIDASPLNAFCHFDREHATLAAGAADVSLPFGGVPIGVKELDQVAGWPFTYASVPFADRVATSTSTMVHRIRDLGGAVLAGQTTASEFGGMNFTRTVLHGTTCNPWQIDRTPGGSSGGTAAAVAAGLLTIGSASDGGGSIRIPAGFCGLVGLKATFGRIPMSPNARYGNLTSVVGCLSRSVRDTARWFDVANGHDARDPLSLQRVEGWEAGLGSLGDQLRGLRVAVVDDWGGATLSPAMWDVLSAAADELIADAGLVRVDGIDTGLPRMGAAWSVSGMTAITSELGDAWPDCADVLTPEMRNGIERTVGLYSADVWAKYRATADGGQRSDGPHLRPRRRRRPRDHGEQPRRRLRRRRPAAEVLRRHRGGQTQQRPADVPGQPPRQPGDLHPRRLGRRPPRRAAGASAVTSASRCCSSSPTSSNATVPGS